MLSTIKYSTRCVLGMEIFYALGIGYGSLLSDKGRELHQALFELIPGFVWGNVVSMLRGAVYIGILAWVVGWYVAWMHNTSVITRAK